MLFREGCHQLIGLPNGLLSLANMYVCMYWPVCVKCSLLDPGATVTSHKVVALNVCMHVLLVSDAVLAFHGCGQIGLSVSLSLSLPSFHSFRHFSYFAEASVNSGLSIIFSCNALTNCAPLRPIL